MSQSGVPAPPPAKPAEPEPGACCQSGCDPCVYDIYWAAMDRYEKALAVWQEKFGKSSPDDVSQ